jgi:hypothetical protein
MASACCLFGRHEDRRTPAASEQWRSRPGAAEQHSAPAFAGIERYRLFPRPWVVRRTKNLSSARATSVQAAAERWLASHGSVTTVSAEAPAEGKVRLAARITGSDAAKLDLLDPAIQVKCSASSPTG